MLLLIRDKYKSVLKLIIVIIIFYFLFKTIYLNWTQIAQHRFKFDLSFLALSYLFLFLHATLLAYQWHLILRATNEEIGFLKSFSIHYLSQVGKYVPGFIWTIIGKLYLTQKEGIAKERVLLSILYQNAILVLTGIIILSSVLFFEERFMTIYGYHLLGLAIMSSIVVFYPKCLNRILENILRLFKINYIPITISYKISLSLLPLFVFTWIVGGIAFFCFVHSFYEISFYELPTFIGIFTMAGIIGLVPITPGSIGIREGIFSFLLSFTIPLHFAVSISLLSRFWTTLGELLLISVAYISRRS